jgi:multicomponent Na+:H+ antiporter subunit D
MSWIPPLLVAIPLLAAAVIAGGDHVAPDAVQNVLAIGAAAATLVLALVLMVDVEGHAVVHWFGGWRPRGGVAIGIAFVADPLSAGLAALAAGVVLLAVVYSVAYLREESHLVDCLLLVCCGALCGFALSGDLFNMFVWLELMGVAAYALTGFKVKELGPLQGSINFAIANTVGSYLFVIGIALTYARTGALNLAQIGQSLAHGRPDGLVIVALTFVVCGFLCKAAIVPFHFWLADAYAVAPAPVCALFAAVMTDIGLVGIAKTYWTAFGGAVGPHAHVVGDLLLWLGIVTALLGGVMAFLQRHLKRMLAYSVICHIGAMLAGIGLLSARGLAGTADLLLAHGLLTAGLFLAVGILRLWLGSIDELDLRGRGRPRPWLAALWFAAALGLAGPPYVGVFLGHAQIDDAAAGLGRHWVQPLLWLGGALASAALLRAGARIFLGWGVADDPLLSPRLDEQPPGVQERLGVLAPATVVAIVAGLVVSVTPGLAQRSELGAERFQDRGAYVATVLRGRPLPTAPTPPFGLAHSSAESLLYATAATLLSLVLAWVGLAGVRLRLVRPAVGALKAVHSGIVGDYVVWITVGTALVGGVWAIGLR